MNEIAFGQLGVSRASLREALSILDTLGVVRIQPARGTFVADEGGSAEQRELHPGSWRFASRYTPGEVHKFRHMAEFAGGLLDRDARKPGGGRGAAPQPAGLQGGDAPCRSRLELEARF